MSNQNPFKGGPTTAQKFMFGTLSLRSNNVNLERGASYTELDLLTKDGNLYDFRGKHKTPNGWARHTILVLKSRNRDGVEYNAFRDFLYRADDEAQKIAGPALRHFFDENLSKIWKQEAEVKIEVVAYEDRGYDKTTFKVVEVYTDRPTREAAEQTHFAQFSAPIETGAEIAKGMPGFEDEGPMPWEEPVEAKPKEVTMKREDAVNFLQPLWMSSGQDADKFYEALAGMIVLTEHFGTTPDEFRQVPEIAVLVIEQAFQSEEGV